MQRELNLARKSLRRFARTIRQLTEALESELVEVTTSSRTAEVQAQPAQAVPLTTLVLPPKRANVACARAILRLLYQTQKRHTGQDLVIALEKSDQEYPWCQAVIEASASWLRKQGAVDNDRDHMGTGYGLTDWHADPLAESLPAIPGVAQPKKYSQQCAQAILRLLYDTQKRHTGADLVLALQHSKDHYDWCQATVEASASYLRKQGAVDNLRDGFGIGYGLVRWDQDPMEEQAEAAHHLNGHAR